MINSIFWIFLITVFIRGVLTFNFLFKSLSFIKNRDLKLFSLNDYYYNKNPIFIIIPALREQQNIISTLKYFIKITDKIENIIIIVVTTNKEKEKEYIGKSTQKMVSDFIKKNIFVNIKIVNYPFKKGYMSHQLNYAVKTLREKRELTDASYIAVYNADSRPHPDTFKWVVQRFNSDKENMPVVLQQSSVFLKNFYKFKSRLPFLGIAFLQSAVLLQTRWTLTHELPRLLRQRYGSSLMKKYANAHCVGHGLIINSKILKELNDFSENTMTEDLFLGYLIRSVGYTIEPIPLLEYSDSPSNLKKLLRQKYVWFWGPMYYPYYFGFFLKNLNSFYGNKLRAFIFMIQGVISALAWLSSGPIIIFICVYPLIIDSYILYILVAASILLYGPLQYYYILRNYNFLTLKSPDSIKNSLNFFNNIIISLLSVPNIIIHSIPPYLSLIAEIRRILFRTQLLKYKTED